MIGTRVDPAGEGRPDGPSGPGSSRVRRWYRSDVEPWLSACSEEGLIAYFAGWTIFLALSALAREYPSFYLTLFYAAVGSLAIAHWIHRALLSRSAKHAKRDPRPKDPI